MEHYILDGKKVKTVDLMTWAKWFETANRIVKQQKLSNGRWVSTVFLGIDHRFLGGRPLLFETMVFIKGTFLEVDCDRYATWEEAEMGHKRMVRKWKLRKGGKNNG